MSSVMSIVSILGTCLSVAILLCIMSIMNGFEGELKSRMLAPGSHLEVFLGSSSEKTGLEVLSFLEKDHRVSKALIVTEGEVLINHGKLFRSATFRGIGSTSDHLEQTFFRHLSVGSPDEFLSHEFGVLLGSELAESLAVTIGDRVTVALPRPILSPVGLFPRTKRFRVAGIFKFDVNGPDSSLAIARSEAVGKFFPEGGRLKLISVMLFDPESAVALTKSLEMLFDVKVESWREKYKTLFMALRVEKIVMFAMLLMAVFIALLNMTSILLVNVTSKKKDIAILAGFGLTGGQAARIFFVQGALTGLIGITLGLFLGMFLSVNIEIIVAAFEQILGFRVFSPDIYYISRVPSKLVSQDVFLITVISIIAVLFAALGPACLSARLSSTRGLSRE